MVNEYKDRDINTCLIQQKSYYIKVHHNQGLIKLKTSGTKLSYCKRFSEIFFRILIEAFTPDAQCFALQCLPQLIKNFSYLILAISTRRKTLSVRISQRQKVLQICFMQLCADVVIVAVYDIFHELQLTIIYNCEDYQDTFDLSYRNNSIYFVNEFFNLNKTTLAY